MKKKILTLLIVYVTFFSCSDNDDNLSTGGQIIGEWGYYQVTNINADGSETLIETYNDYQETVTFSSNGTFISRDNDLGVNINGTWKYLGGNKYEAQFGGFSNEIIVNFICDGNIFKQLDENSSVYDYFERIGYDRDTCDEDDI